MAAPPIKIKGKSNPLTIFSAVRVWYRYPLIIFLTIVRLLVKLTIVSEIMFIHFACWQPLSAKKFPRLSEDQPLEELTDDYFLFTTNFNGPWDQYIDAFGLIKGVRGGLNLIWQTSRGFPKAWPLRPFKRYIHYYEFGLDYYYNAYPEMSVRDIRAVYELSEMLDEFTSKAEGMPTAEEFNDEFHHFLDEAASRLGSTGGDGQQDEYNPFHHASPSGLQL